MHLCWPYRNLCPSPRLQTSRSPDTVTAVHPFEHLTSLSGYLIYCMASRFSIRLEDEVSGFIDALPTVPRAQVERDLEKLATRGLGALPPLTGNVEGPVWELRSKVDGYGLYRIFYYRDGLGRFTLSTRTRRRMSGCLPGYVPRC